MSIIDKPSDYFNTILYTGNGSTQSITGVGFQPDWVWIKGRSVAYSHILHDSVRTATKELKSNSTGAEGTDANGLTSFNSDGFSLGTGGAVNNNGTTYSSWNWKAGTSFTNDASATGIGTIDSTGSVNTDAGFSIISYTGNATAGATVAHGLGVKPSFYILKSRNTANTWYTYHKNVGATKTVPLNTTDGELSTSYANSTEPTSSVFSLGSAAAFNGSGDTFIAYCFAEKQGYSKFGSYTGNGNADGPFVYTGFKPSWLSLKRTDSTSQWKILDNKRLGYNPSNSDLYADSSEVENTVTQIDFLSNGFKIKHSSTALNASGGTYIYMAFAEQPFTTSTTNGSIPATAR